MSVSLKKENQVSYLEFSSEKANSFSAEMLEQLSTKLINVDLDTKVIVLCSSGDRAFSAGASFNEFNQIKSYEQALKYFSGFAKVLNSIRLSECPVICRVQGKAVGGAVGLIAACDYVFSLNQSEVKLSELDLGIGPFTISPALERKIGIAKFSEMLFDTNWKDSNWAVQVGLFTQVFDDVKSMDSEIKTLLNKLCLQSKKALLANRKILWAGTENWPELMKERAGIVSELLMLNK